MALVKRLVKGSPLTFAEGDANLDYLYQLATSTGSSSVTGSVNVSGSSTVTGSFSVFGPANVGGSLSVSGSSTVTGSMIISGSSNITGSLNVVGPSRLTGSLNVTGSFGITGSFSFHSSTGSVFYLPYVSGSFTTGSLSNLTGSGAPFLFVINGELWFYNGTFFVKLYP